jgi:hypothetical protein
MFFCGNYSVVAKSFHFFVSAVMAWNNPKHTMRPRLAMNDETFLNTEQTE